MNILVVEDNLEVADYIKGILEEENFRVQVQIDDQTIPDLSRIDLILLDENLNGKSGLEFLQTLKTKNWKGPVIMVTGNDREDTIRKAFHHGVDDYVTKPFKPLVLVGKIRALSRRMGIINNETIVVGDMDVLVHEHRVRIKGGEIPLTKTEFNILYQLVAKANSLVTRDNIKNEVFRGLHVTNRTIDVHICSLRKKIKDSQNDLKTVRGVGYRFISA